MKKRVALLLGMAFMLSGTLAGCGGSGDRVATNEGMTTQTQQEETKTESGLKTEGSLKTGLAFTASIADSTDAKDLENAADEDGVAEADVTIAAVTVDKDGKVVSCKIDEAQITVRFDEEGRITTDLTSEILTKQELGEDYGMKNASSIGKEWNEQADAFAAYCVGKTADEINGIAVNADGAAEDKELASSCTIYIGNFQKVVTKAINNAK